MMMASPASLAPLSPWRRSLRCAAAAVPSTSCMAHGHSTLRASAEGGRASLDSSAHSISGTRLLLLEQLRHEQQQVQHQESDCRSDVGAAVDVCRGGPHRCKRCCFLQGCSGGGSGCSCRSPAQLSHGALCRSYAQTPAAGRPRCCCGSPWTGGSAGRMPTCGGETSRGPPPWLPTPSSLPRTRTATRTSGSWAARKPVRPRWRCPTALLDGLQRGLTVSWSPGQCPGCA